jgi:hypothetical protein
MLWVNRARFFTFAFTFEAPQAHLNRSHDATRYSNGRTTEQFSGTPRGTRTSAISQSTQGDL